MGRLEQKNKEGISIEKSSRIAPDGMLWVCCQCGKTTKDRFGGPSAMRGWDEACFLNARLFPESSLIRGEDGYVTEIKEEQSMDQ